MLIMRIGSNPVLLTPESQAQLRQHGMLCERVDSVSEAQSYLRLYEYDVLLMDQHLRDGSCQEAVRQLRVAGCKVPIVILADGASARTKADLLDQGADDFVTVPCASEELFARIRAVVRRSKGHANSTLTSGTVEFSLDRRQLRAHGRALALSRQEFMVLELMFLRNGTIVTKTALFNHLYCGQDEREMKTIDVIICRLRKKLAAAGMASLIDTVWGHGYRLHTGESGGLRRPVAPWPETQLPPSWLARGAGEARPLAVET